MRLITRYVLLELVKVFSVSLLVLTSIFLMFGLVVQATEQGLGPAQIVQIVPFLLPDMLRYTIPATILYAACSVYGRMASANEVVALKSLGIGPWAILMPGFVFSFILSLLAFWLNDVAVSWGQRGVQRVVVEAVEEIAYGMLRTQRSFSSKQFSIMVQGVDGKRLINPTITIQARNQSPAMTVTAREAELISDPSQNLLKIVFRDGSADVEGRATFVFQDEWPQELPLDKAAPSGDNSFMPARMEMRVIPTEIDKTIVQIDRMEQEYAIKAAGHLLLGEFDALAQTPWGVEGQNLQDRRNHLYRLRTEPWRRMAGGFSCLCFVLIGAPMAIRLRHSDPWMTFFMCFLPILLGYYPLLVFGLEQAKNGILHPSVVWLGNIVLAGWGLVVLRRVIRY